MSAIGKERRLEKGSRKLPFKKVRGGMRMAALADQLPLASRIPVTGERPSAAAVIAG
jgi:hypothetical protein